MKRLFCLGVMFFSVANLYGMDQAQEQQSAILSYMALERTESPPPYVRTELDGGGIVVIDKKNVNAIVIYPFPESCSRHIVNLRSKYRNAPKIAMVGLNFIVVGVAGICARRYVANVFYRDLLSVGMGTSIVVGGIMVGVSHRLRSRVCADLESYVKLTPDFYNFLSKIKPFPANDYVVYIEPLKIIHHNRPKEFMRSGPDPDLDPYLLPQGGWAYLQLTTDDSIPDVLQKFVKPLPPQ